MLRPRDLFSPSFRPISFFPVVSPVGMFWTSLSWLGTARTANYAGSMAEWKANGKPLATSA